MEERKKRFGDQAYNMILLIPDEKTRIKVASMCRKDRRKWFKQNKEKLAQWILNSQTTEKS